MLRKFLVDKEKFIEDSIIHQWRHYPVKRAYLQLNKIHETYISRIFLSLIGHEEYETLHKFDPEGKSYIPPTAVLSVRGDGDYSDEVFDFTLEFEKAYEMFAICKSKLFFERYHVKIDDKEWLVDIYRLDNEGLALASLVSDPDYKINKQEWMIKDVSFYPQFSELNLSIHPYLCFYLEEKTQAPFEISKYDKISCSKCQKYGKCHSPRYDEPQ